DAGDVADRAVAVLGVAQHQLTRGVELLVQILVRVPAALAVLHRNGQLLSLLAPRRERRVRLLDAEPHVAADELELAVGPEHAGEEACLAEDLEAVADPEHRPAVGCERAHRVQHRGEARERAAAPVVAVREAAGKHDRAGPARQLPLGVPDELGVRAEGGERPGRIAVVGRAREDEHRELRPVAHSPSTSIWKLSISGFASSSWHMRSTWSLASCELAASTSRPTSSPTPASPPSKPR